MSTLCGIVNDNAGTAVTVGCLADPVCWVLGPAVGSLNCGTGIDVRRLSAFRLFLQNTGDYALASGKLQASPIAASGGDSLWYDFDGSTFNTLGSNTTLSKEYSSAAGDCVLSYIRFQARCAAGEATTIKPWLIGVER